MPTFYEFFAGGGMVRAGLGRQWRCLFANDFDARKAAAYRQNWGAADLREADIASLRSADLPGRADLAWASFPCQDLSLAGGRRGLSGARSGTFWHFWRLMTELRAENRGPELIALENVYGVLTSNHGQDFQAIARALTDGGYRIGGLVIDAAHFLPQSRPRFFLIAARDHLRVPAGLQTAEPDPRWGPSRLVDASQALPERVRQRWVWWNVPAPPGTPTRLAALVEPSPAPALWHSAAETTRLLRMMSPLHREKVRTAQASRALQIGTVYRRTRADGSGRKAQRAEVRFDDIAGCLRTPAGGSSRQILLLVDGARVRSRLLSPREAARLMGLPDGYRLPTGYHDAYRLAGDGVAVPIVAHLRRHLFTPLLQANSLAVATKSGRRALSSHR